MRKALRISIDVSYARMMVHAALVSTENGRSKIMNAASIRKDIVSTRLNSNECVIHSFVMGWIMKLTPTSRNCHF